MQVAIFYVALQYKYLTNNTACFVQLSVARGIETTASVKGGGRFLD
jgi:hypothetical protein